MDLGRFRWLAIFIAVIWGVEAINLVMGYAFNGWFGLRPRAVGGLDGILFMPILHGSVSHAAANTVPLVLLGGLLVVTARPMWR